MATRSYGDETHEMREMPRRHYPREMPRRHYPREMGRSRENLGEDKGEPRDNEPQPRYLSNMARGRTSSFYINGDVFFPSKRVIYNPSQFKDFHNYLDYLTERLVPRFGAVRKICTPRHGGRILELEDLQEEGVYVVVGSEKFKPYRYDQIRPSDRRRSPAVSYNAEPVYHNRQFVSSGKIRKCDTQSLLIKVWPNGGDLKGPRRVLISPRIRPYTLQNVISHVNELLKEDCLGTVERLYFLSGSQVSDVEQVIQNGQYVACRKNERFKKARYNEQAVKNLATSPRLDRKLLAPLFFARSLNSTIHSSADQSQGSTQNSVTSYTNRRRAPDDDDDDRVFPARPVKYKRDAERVRTIDLDKDQGRLFKAKQPNNNTRGATEVPDSRHVKTDLPVDQWDVHEVHEDVSQRRDTRKTLPQINDYYGGGTETKKSSHKPSSRSKEADSNDKNMEQSAMKIQASYRGYRTRKEMVVNDSHMSAANNRNKGPYTYDRIERDNSSDDKLDDDEKAAAKIQAGYRGYQTRKFVSEEKAATKIQSSFRGHQDRKQLASRQKETAGTDVGRRTDKAGKTAPKLQDKDKGQGGPRPRQTSFREDSSYDELDKENNAALTIQSHYRGYRTRRGLANRRVAAN